MNLEPTIPNNKNSTKTRRVIITGGPGTGKSSLLMEIAKLGYHCHPEVSRKVIRQQQELKTNLLPWDDLGGFSRLVFKEQMKQYRQAHIGSINFYDRGIPDVVAYLRKDGIHEEQLEVLCHRYRYSSPVFLTPPWPEIYDQDEERWEDIQTMIKIHETLKNVYSDFGYQVLEVPKISVLDRVNFVLDYLNDGA